MKTFLKTLLSYKLALVILVAIIAFVAGSLKLREILINSSSTDKQTVSFDDYLPLPTDIPSSNSALTASPSPTQAVLGTSTSTGAIPILVPIPTSPGVPTYAPIPTTAPVATNTSSSSSSSSGCTTRKTAYDNSYARYPSNPVAVGSNVTITIDLRDCNNQATLGNDAITVTPKSVDSTFQFVGFGSGSFPLPHGQTSFQVTSSNPGTNTFTIRDTTGGFDVTGDNYATPTVIFTGSSPTSTPNPTPTPTPTNSPSPQPTTASPSATITP